MQTRDFELYSPEGEILHLEDISSIRSIHLSKLQDKENAFFIDVVDMQGVYRKNYTCSFNCINYTALMLFVENEKEDKTNINISFEALMCLLTSSRHLGYNEAMEESSSSEDTSDDVMEELLKREPNVLLN